MRRICLHRITAHRWLSFVVPLSQCRRLIVGYGCFRATFYLLISQFCSAYKIREINGTRTIRVFLPARRCASAVIAKFHYTGPTRTRTRTFLLRNSVWSVRVRSGPCPCPCSGIWLLLQWPCVRVRLCLSICVRHKSEFY